MTARRTIFYDGLCQLCSREIDLFRRRVTDGRLAFVDISDPGFDPAAHGLDPVRVQKEMHVRVDDTGEVRVGVDALAAMWEAVPGFRWLAVVTRLTPVKPLARAGYAVFAWVRPMLPKRKRPACDSGTCPVG